MHQTKETFTNKLSTWLLWRPLQFTFGFLTVSLLLSIIYGLIIGWIAPATTIIWPLWTTVGLTFIFGIRWLNRKLPSENLDYRSYVAVFTATNIIIFITYLTTILCALALIQNMLTSATIGFGTIAALTSILILGTYAVCLSLTELIATYRRIRNMGVNRRIALLNIPFGLCLLAAPAYILPDATRKRKTSITFGTGAYAKFVEWITSKRIIAFSLMALGLIITTIIMGVNNSATLGWIGLAFFGIWYVIGRNDTKRTIGNTYVKTTALLNILCIIIALATAFYVANRTSQYSIEANIETIEMVE